MSTLLGFFFFPRFVSEVSPPDALRASPHDLGQLHICLFGSDLMSETSKPEAG